MSAIFPSPEWLHGLEGKLNSDEKYAETAKNWEGDVLFNVVPDGNLDAGLSLYFDLWHGECRFAEYGVNPEKYPDVVFTLSAKYSNITAILTGKLDPMTAIMTNKLKVKGNWGYMMRNVPTVLDFVRCAREVTTEIL